MEKMTFYEIDEALSKCFDEETGEILNEEDFEKLNEARDDKIEGIGLMIKNREALKDEIDNEIKRLRDRKLTLENQVENTKAFLARLLDGQKFETARVRMSWRKSKAVEIADESILPDEYIVTKTTTAPDKKKIKEALAEGKTIGGCNLRETNNLSVK